MDIVSTIEAKLATQFAPQHLEIINESSNHNVPKDSQTHFKIIIVANSFKDLSLLQRHRNINETLAKEFTLVHAISIHAYTPLEWNDMSHNAPTSPVCRGGSKQDTAALHDDDK